MIQITQQDFERFCPTFRDSEERIFEMVAPRIAEEQERVYAEFGVEHVETDVEDILRLYVILRAAYEEVPALDLVATENGFAVVSNQNLAPASKERVANLRETLRQSADDARCELIHALMVNESYIPTLVLSNLPLLWGSSLCNSLGVRTASGGKIYHDEYEGLLPAIHAATANLENIISPEEVELLEANQFKMEGAPSGEGWNEYDRSLLQLSRLFIATVLDTGQTSPATKHFAKKLLKFVTDHEAQLPAYAASKVCEARKIENYENKKEYPCFFFG